MKSTSLRTWIGFAVVLLVEVLLALSPFIPALNSIVRSTLHTSDPVDVQITLTGMYAVLLTLFLGTAFATIQRYLCDTRKQIEDSLREKPSIKVLRDDEFHEDFLVACRRAKSHVLITNLSPTPLYFSGSRDRKLYLAKLLRIIRKKPDVQFRRLIRSTPGNIEFATELISKLEGNPNAHLALIKDSAGQENPLALSVQIIDDHDCWIVALSAHERQSSYRDIHIRDQTFAQAMYRYHERLWQKAVRILESGAITNDWKAICQATKEDTE